MTGCLLKIRKTLIDTLVVLVLVISCTAENCDKYGVLFYEDIACKPVKTEGKECPSSYDCDFSQQKSGCLLKGKNYAIGEDITSDLTYSACEIGCFCHDLNYIICAVLDCAEWLGPPLQPGCHYGYELGKCCSTRQICNSTQTKKCDVDGKTYQIGQEFQPKNTCYSCVCHENFTGEYDEKTCIKKNCFSQKSCGSAITQNCAPVYFSRADDVLCCPNDFVCPDASDMVTVIDPNAEKNSTLECFYGARKLKLGEGLRRQIKRYEEVRDLQCECILPPLLTCKEIL